MSAISVALAVFCVVCYTGQTFLSKLFSLNYTGPAAAATPVFAAVYGAFTGLVTLAYNGFHFDAAFATVLFGIGNGFVLFFFNLATINASRTGPYAFQSILMLFGNILLPLMFTVLCWGDRLTGLRILGILIMLLSFVLFNMKGLHLSGTKKGYYFWAGLLFLTNGLYGIILDAQQRVMLQMQRNEMIIVTFFTSAVISVCYLLMQGGPKAFAAFRMSGKSWGFTFGSSICAAAAVNSLMLTMRYVPTSVLYTISNGGVLVASSVLSALVFREKLNRWMVIGIAAAVLSLILLSL